MGSQCPPGGVAHLHTSLNTPPRAPVELSIIIVNWMSVAFTRRCLASVCATTSDLRYEIIVVDNASYDGCAQMIQVEFPHVQFIQSHQNLGFAQANNLAFETSHGRHVLFLNPDTEVLPGAIQRLLLALNAIPDAGMVGAQLLNSDYSLQTTCVTALPSIINQCVSSDYLRRRFPKWRIWGMRPLFSETLTPVPVDAISGACMLARRKVIQNVRGFTSQFFMYSEDMDLCVKLKRDGWKIYYVPSAQVIHHAAGSSSLREEAHFASMMVRQSVAEYMRMHRGPAYAALYKLSMGVTALVRIGALVVAVPFVVGTHNYDRISRSLSKWSELLAWSMSRKRLDREGRPNGSGGRQPPSAPSIVSSK